MLIIVFTITDVRYRFRIQIAPLPLFMLTYVIMTMVGVITLTSDVWFAKEYLVPDFLPSQAVVQFFAGGTFLLITIIWIYFAFIAPPVFTKYNYRRFAQAFFDLILRGSDEGLSAIAHELGRSACQLVKLADAPVHKERAGRKWRGWFPQPKAQFYAHDVLLLIGNRKLCRKIACDAPSTAIALFDAVSAQKKYRLPIEQFSRNVASEVILNRDSIIYHEDNGFSSGLVGHLKPFTQSLFGNYRLMETLAERNGSPLDIDFNIGKSLDAQQLNVYCRVSMVTLEAYLAERCWPQHSYTLYRAIHLIERSTDDLYRLVESDGASWQEDIYKRLAITMEFISGVIDKLQENSVTPICIRARGEKYQGDLYDNVARRIFEIILKSSYVNKHTDLCWSVQHNAIWSHIFDFNDGSGWKIIRAKLRRLLYDEIKRLEKFPNYKSARILGYCLNVMGVKLAQKAGYAAGYYPLHKATLRWVERNYARLRKAQPDVASACLIGSISFDKKNQILIKTYAKGLSLEEPKEHLQIFHETE
jgi:hypothetical protein